MEYVDQTKNLLVLPELAGNNPTSLSPLQELLAAQMHSLQTIWWTVWFLTLSYLLGKHLLPPIFRTLRNQFNAVDE